MPSSCFTEREHWHIYEKVFGGSGTSLFYDFCGEILSTFLGQVGDDWDWGYIAQDSFGLNEQFETETTQLRTASDRTEQFETVVTDMLGKIVTEVT